MKKICTVAAGLLLGLAASNTSYAWQQLGYVFCDANQNQAIDSLDTPVQGVLVITTNLSGTFSNSSWTAASGFFIIQLQDGVPDTYVSFIASATLTAGTTAVLPAVNVFTTSATSAFITNNFLIENAICVPPPPPHTNMCWLTGGGTIKSGKGQPDYTFGGVVYPGCNSTSAGGGNWNVVAHTSSLHFKGENIAVVTCGNVPGYPPGSRSPATPFNFIDFMGTGTLEGVAGSKSNFGTVYFYARAEDHSEPGHGSDRLYLRVYDSTGLTLLLISNDQADATDIAPVPISTGNLQLHISGCD